jgi:hypothetical protein
VQQLEGKLELSRDEWRKAVKLRFDAQKLTDAQRSRAESAFAMSAMKLADEFAKVTSLPGTYRTLILIPVYDPAVCTKMEELRKLSSQAAEGYRKILWELLPMVETVSEVARRDP